MPKKEKKKIGFRWPWEKKHWSWDKEVKIKLWRIS